MVEIAKFGSRKIEDQLRDEKGRISCGLKKFI